VLRLITSALKLVYLPQGCCTVPGAAREVGLATTVYVHDVCNRIFGDFPAKHTLCALYTHIYIYYNII